MKKLQQEQREPEELLFIKGVQKLVPASMSTLRRWWRLDPPQFPVPKLLGTKRLAWDRSEILAWVASRPLIARRGYGAAADRDAGASDTVMSAKGGES